jgi:predicted Zn-dependent protease
MSILKADYYDGKKSVRHPVSLILSGKILKVVGARIDVQADIRRVRRSLRIGSTPRWLYLPGGGACVTDDNDAVDRITRKLPYDRLLQRWENRPTLAALAVGIVALFTWLLVTYAVPRAAEEIASRIPPEAEAVLGSQALAGMDRAVLQPSTLSTERQAHLKERFRAMMRAAHDPTPYRLEFRASPLLGANAFALPSGIVVVLDGLVRLAVRDEEVLGVLAHEVGHVHYRHTMRRLLEGSATALLVAGLTGDIASSTSLAAAAPALLLQMKYSRDDEREADAYAVDTMTRAGLDGRALAVMLGRLEKAARQAQRVGVPTFLSSHPATKERRAAILAALGTSVQAQEDREREERKNRQPDGARRYAPPASQQEILALVDKADFDALERTLAGYQQRYEDDPAKEEELYTAFATFRLVKPGAEPTLRRWTEKMPQSYSASLALGIFYLWHGIEARGTAYVADTPPEKLRRLTELLSKARPELERSTGLTARPYLSHLSLVTLSRYVGDRELGRQHYLAGIQVAPQSLRLRRARMTSLEPKWGGSYAEMEALARESAAQLKDRAAIADLAASVPAAKADDFRSQGEFEKAAQLYADALRINPAANELRCTRAWALSQGGRHAEAYVQAKQGFDLDRHSGECMNAALWAARQMKDRDKVAAFATLAIESNPNWAYPYTQRGWASEKGGQRAAAFQDYLAAAKLGDAWSEMRAGHGYFMGWGVQVDRDKGIEWLRKAAADGNVEAKGMLAKALQLTGKP